MAADFCSDNLSINFESYKVFYLVATLASTTQAAESLFLTQPAVSKSIHHLEETLGCALFVRTQKGMALTEAGRELYHYISQAYELIMEGQKRMRQMMNLDRGVIRVGTDEMTVHFALLPKLEQFNQEHANIKMDISNYRRSDLLPALREGIIDFAVIMCQDEVFQNVERIELSPVSHSFIAGPKYETMKGKAWTLEQILEYPTISLAKDMSARIHLDEFFKHHGLLFHPDIELTSTTLIVPFAEKNLGIGIVARNFAEDSLREGRVFELQVTPEIPPRKTCILIDNKTPTSVASKEFLSKFVGNTAE